ncbi:30S ribosomal protein S10 [Spiroplasma endosymbiont of Anurida maritima]|uniref:30S ribosomal protein S10 n=1 Tax=Spiroplasma endosymbiont of Anurida maritima TaxID=2967972 RepID=UPI0036D291DB
MKKGTNMRVKIVGHDHRVVDFVVKKLLLTIKESNGKSSGPIPLPTKKEITTVIKPTHKYKDSREQFIKKDHSRIIELYSPDAKVIDSLSRVQLPSGVLISIK